MPGKTNFKCLSRSEPIASLGKAYYSTDLGGAFLGDALDYLKVIPSESIQLIVTSPPFALTRKKEYGNKGESEYVDWFLKFAVEFKRVLTENGSLVIDLGGSYLSGKPIRSIYQFELLVRMCHELHFRLAQEFFHYNPSRLPAPAEWVTVRRVRVKDSVNMVWWLAKSDNPKADNRNVLKPYSDSMLQLFKNGYKPKLRPSGHDISGKFAQKNEGAIPSNLLELPNTESNSLYLRRCKEEGIKPHPARFPPSFPEFFIKYLTNIEDIVLDPFAGSNTTGYAAENLNRKWIAIESKEEYLYSSVFRFEKLEGLFNRINRNAIAKKT
jgi:DNA modification methylase